MPKQKQVLFALAAILLAAPVVLLAYIIGPEPGRTGAPNELQTCVECHVGGGVNSGPGGVRISFDGGAASYTPGQTIRLTVRVEDPDQRRWGFQLTARREGAIEQAGSFTIVEPQFTQRICSDTLFGERQCTEGRLEFVQHNTGGTRRGTPQGAEWQVDWTAPASDIGPIVFYAAGNASDNSDTEFGDRIYTTSAALTPQAAAPPTISQNGVVHGASFKLGIAKNTFITIFGQNLASATGPWDNAFVGTALPRSLNGTSVRVNNQDAFVAFTSPGQINVLTPADLGTGDVTVTVTTPGGTSESITTVSQSVAPAFFIFNNDKYVAARHPGAGFIGPVDLFPGLTTPAAPNEIVEIYGTGFGQTDPPVPNGELPGVRQLPVKPTVRVGGLDAAVEFAGLAGFAGLYQLNIRIPEALPSGDHEIILTTEGVSSPAGALITVQR